TPLGLAACLVAAGSFGTPASASADTLGSTTLTPAGHAYAAALVPGTTAAFTVGATTVNCNTSTATGAIPAAPDNHNAAGAVTSIVSPPTYVNNGEACPTTVALTSAEFQ